MKQGFIKLNEWFKTRPGKRAAFYITQHLQETLEPIVGLHLLQCGIEEQRNWLQNSAITNHHVLTPFISQRPHALCAHLDEEFIPIASETTQVVILPFCLELLDNPLAFLNEVNRILTIDGQVILIGLNPNSPLGINKALRKNAFNGIGRSKLCSLYKLRGLLQKAGFQVERTEQFYYSPSFHFSRHLEQIFEQIGRMIGPYPGGLYMVLAKKNPPMPVTPILKYGGFVVGRQR